MRYFLDTEFMEDGRTVELLSLGIVCHQDGRELYLVNGEADRSKANAFVREHVVPKLNVVAYHPRLFAKETTRKEMREITEAFLNFGGKKPSIWAYYADYDWIALCQLFGQMVDLPKHWPMYARDLKQLLDMAGNPIVQVKKPDMLHHALYDARWERDVFEWLQNAVHPAAKQELFRHI